MAQGRRGRTDWAHLAHDLFFFFSFFEWKSLVLMASPEKVLSERNIRTDLFCADAYWHCSFTTKFWLLHSWYLYIFVFSLLGDFFQFKTKRFTESGGTVVSPRTSRSGDPGSILAQGRPPWEGFQWFSFPLQVNTGVVPLQIGHAVYLPPTYPSPSSRYSSITPLFASQSLKTSPLHSDYK